jgi:hypothetical protein
MTVNNVRITNNPYTLTINRDTVISNVAIEANSNSGSSGRETTEETVTNGLRLMGRNMSDIINTVSSVQEETADTYNNLDPINHEILSEYNLMNNSLVIDGCVETYAELSNLEGNELDNAKDLHRQDLVDYLIINNNPIYNYKSYSDRDRNNLVSLGSLVLNDYEYVENGEETDVYWQVKILGDETPSNNFVNTTNVEEAINDAVWGDNTEIPRLEERIQNAGNNSLVNNKYYVLTAGITSLENGTTLELLVKNND